MTDNRQLPPHLEPAYRRSGIGGSDLGAILGVNKYKTPLDVYAEKLGLKEPQGDSPAMRWGRRLEPAIAAEFEAIHGVELLPGYHINKEFDGVHFLLTPDFICEEQALVVEIKTAGIWSAKEWGMTGEDGAPMSYAAQVAAYLWGLGLPAGVIPALIGGQDYREYPQQRDEELELAILSAGAKFWRDNVEAKVAPAAANLADERRWIERRYRQNLETAVLVANEEQALHLETLAEIRAALKELEVKEETVENALRLAIGDNSGLASGAWVYLWKNSKPSRPNPPKELNLSALSVELNIPLTALMAAIIKHTAERPGSRRSTFNPVKTK